MYLDRNKSLGFISALALTVAFGCSSKNTSDGTGTGGAAFCQPGQSGCGAGGASNTDAGATKIDWSKYCNGLFASVPCDFVPTVATIKTPNMLIVVDESGSMNQMASTTSTGSKWAEMRQALQGALTQTKVRSNINFGLELFPNSGDSSNPIDPNSSDPLVACTVPSDVNQAIEVPIISGTDQVDAILGWVNAATPTGGTPTNKALQEAYTYFTTSPGKDLPGDKFVLLATDGGPNCNSALNCTKDTCTQNMDLLCGDHTVNTTINCCDSAGYICLDDTATIAEIGNLKAAGISTYVIGIPGSEAYSATLNQMATAGGKPNTQTGATTQYYAVSASNSLADLQAAFTDIITQLVTSCDIPIGSNPQDIDKVNVVIDCVPAQKVPINTPMDGGASAASGYYIDYSQNPAHLALVGNVCNNLLVNGAKEVDVIQGCPGVQ